MMTPSEIVLVKSIARLIADQLKRDLPDEGQFAELVRYELAIDSAKLIVDGAIKRGTVEQLSTRLQKFQAHDWQI